VTTGFFPVFAFKLKGKFDEKLDFPKPEKIDKKLEKLFFF